MGPERPFEIADPYLAMRSAVARSSDVREPTGDYVRVISFEELNALNRFLRVCAERGYALFGWS